MRSSMMIVLVLLTASSRRVAHQADNQTSAVNNIRRENDWYSSITSTSTSTVTPPLVNNDGTAPVNTGSSSPLSESPSMMVSDDTRAERTGDTDDETSATGVIADETSTTGDTANETSTTGDRAHKEQETSELATTTPTSSTTTTTTTTTTTPTDTTTQLTTTPITTTTPLTNPTTQPTTTSILAKTTPTTATSLLAIRMPQSTTESTLVIQPPMWRMWGEACINSYSPISVPLKSTFIGEDNGVDWKQAERMCSSSPGYHLLQKGFRIGINDDYCKDTNGSAPLWVMQLNNESYWMNSHGLDMERVPDEDILDWYDDTNQEGGVYGALNLSSGLWHLVDESYQYTACLLCEMTRRKNIRIPIFVDVDHTRTFNIVFETQEDVTIMNYLKLDALKTKLMEALNNSNIERSTDREVNSRNQVMFTIRIDNEKEQLLLNQDTLNSVLSDVNSELATNFTRVFLTPTDRCPYEKTNLNVWPVTKAGRVVVRRNFLLLTSRECYMDHGMARWSEVVDWVEDWKPCDNSIVPNNTDSSILDDAANHLDSLIEFPVLSRQLEDVVDTINNVLVLDENFLADKATKINQILLNFQQILEKMVLEEGLECAQMESDGVTPLITNIVNNDVTVVYSFINMNETLYQKIRFDSSGEAIEFVNDTEIGVVLRHDMLTKDQRVAFSVFPNDKVFPTKQGGGYKIESRIVNIILNESLIQNLEDNILVEIRFKSLSNLEKRCVFWNFDTNSWSPEGCSLNSMNNSVDICFCNHLTHFAIQVTPFSGTINSSNQAALDIISYVGCSLSAIGLICIFIKAIRHKKWRQDLSNKILLHMTCALAINIIAFSLIASSDLEPYTFFCVFVGILMHYSLLACFCWMLVLAILQMMRLLTILGAKGIPYLLLKVSLFAWGAPLIPICVLVFFDINSYNDGYGEKGYCYPSGGAFYDAVFAPVILIIVVNTIVFFIIVFRIYGCFGGRNIHNMTRHGISDRTMALRRLRTSIFLFFLFGISWTFLLFQSYGILFTYLLTITSSLQGFFLFLFLLLLEGKRSDEPGKLSIPKITIESEITSESVQ